MRILFVGSYPNVIEPYMSVFFKALIYEMADIGVECHVISPVSITKYRNRVFDIPEKTNEYTKKGAKISVYYPKIISYSAKKISKWNTMYLTQRSAENSVIKTVRSLGISFDCVYGHFFLGGGLTAACVARTFHIPAFIAYGECDFTTEVASKYTIYAKDMQGVHGIITVSSKNLKDLATHDFATGIPTLLSINSIDQNSFFVKDKKECRKILGIPQNDFVVGFVGYFIERKGSSRLLQACSNLPGVSLAFAGKGKEIPTGKNVVFCQSLEHNDVCTFLNAVDVFCLPTRNEGCSNAIVEAMACGKAIVSSNLPFNWDILNTDNSLLIDPDSISEIRSAIIKLRDDVKLREKLSAQVLEDAKNLSITNRASNILRFICEHL